MGGWIDTPGTPWPLGISPDALPSVISQGFETPMHSFTQPGDNELTHIAKKYAFFFSHQEVLENNINGTS